MSVWIDRKYLLLTSSRLERFSQKKDDLFNFRCPYCGDSKKNKLKARGYVYRKNNDYFYTCHNCHTSTTFSKFLKTVDVDVHRQYVLERYTNGETGHSNYQKPNLNSSLTGPKPSERFSEKLNIKNIKLKSIDELPEEHYAVQYIIKRKIPKQYWSEIFYHDAFKDFLDTLFPDHGQDDVPNDSRIILFYTNQNGDITNVAGRALGKSPIRYCTVKITEDKKLFGMHRMRSGEKIYVVEGQFDSFFIPNCIASGDSNLGSVPEYLENKDCVLVYDNEPRNREIVKQINKAIENDYSVVLFPDSIPFKDINEMILGGMTQEEIMRYITENTSQGLTAKLKFVDWRKC
jgi:transcription elongation factor Elf1